MGKIAIIEDNSDASERIKQLVIQVTPAVEVVQAFNLEDGLAAIEAHNFDLVIVDIDLGGTRGKYGGFTILGRLSSKSNTVTLVVSGAPPEQIHEQVLSLEAYDFVPKPINEIAFLNTYEHALQSVRQQLGDAKLEVELPPHLSRDATKPLAFLWRTKRVNLSLTQGRIVELLATNFGLPVETERLVTLFNSSRAKSALATHVADIRKNFRDVDVEFSAIAAVPGRGYVWKAES